MNRSSLHSLAPEVQGRDMSAADMHLSAWWQALGSAPFGMLLLDAAGTIHSANPAAQALLGDTIAARQWPAPGMRLYGADGGILAECDHPVARAYASRAAVYQTLIGIDLPEGRRWLEMDVRPLLGSTGEISGMVVSLENQTTKMAEEQDSLTGLLTRAALRHHLDQVLARGESATLLVLGLDHFKDVNLSLGHHWGDRLLARVADRLSRTLAPEQRLARLDGDQFALLLPGLCEQIAAEAVAQRVLRAVELPIHIGDQSLTIGASIGIAHGPTDGADAEALLRCADVALHHAKQHHNSVEAFRTSNDPYTPERLRLLADLPLAIETGQLFLCYQPKEDLCSGKITGLEALVRWRHPTAGLIPPDEFIGYAEERGLITSLTVAVLDEATHQLAIWSHLGLEVTVAVNLSARSFHDPLLLDIVCGLCETAGVPTRMLELEITESTVMADIARAHDLLVRLRDRDIRIALDDFGTGYSSLAALRKLPVNTLKLDRSFIREMRTDSAAIAIVESMIDLAHKLDQQVVAEGVEDALTRALLAGMRCDQIQGFYLCKPLPAADITEWLGGRG